MINWPEIARCYAVLRPVEWIDGAVLQYLRSQPDEAPVIVACSGGADSVFLALALHTLLPPDRVVIAHYNHQLRGEASEQDEAFVINLAEGLGLTCETGAPVDSLPMEEAALRDARYQWLLSVATARGAAAIAIGHHADDVIESQLMALCSGCGPAGMASPLAVREFPDGHVRLRPLLGMKRATIERTLRSLGAPWRKDASNEDPRMTRNRVRSELIPRLAQVFPQDIHAASRRTRRLMEEACDALDAMLEELEIDFTKADGFQAGPLIGRARGVARRGLMAWWMRHYPGETLPTGATDKVVDCLHQGIRDVPVSIGPNHVLVLDEENQIYRKKISRPTAANWAHPAQWAWAAGPLFLPGGAQLRGEPATWETGTAPYAEADPGREAWLAVPDASLEVRQWEAGDRYLPLGAPGTRKLQDLFTDAKLNSEQKAFLPVILNNEGRILWVPGFPPADWAKVPAGAKSALRLTYHPH